MTLLVVILVVTVSTLMLTLNVSSSAQPQTASPYPTDYPPEKQTGEAVQRQTQQVGALAALTPNPTGTFWYFPPSTNTPFPVPTQASTPAGVGVIYDDGDD